MHLKYGRYEEIKKIISTIYVDYGISKIPFDVVEFCGMAGFKLIPYSRCSKEKKEFLLRFSEDGLSYYDENKKSYVIIYNDITVSKQRQRFTIMHEVGHIMLEHKNSSDKEEAEANFFARNILAPMPLIILYELNDVNRIATLFDISIECAKISLENYIKRKKTVFSKLKDYEIELISNFKK